MENTVSFDMHDQYKRLTYLYLKEINSISTDPTGIISTYPEVSDIAKIQVLDTIIDHAKDVLSPKGGLIGTLYGGANKLEEFLVVTKDGHDYMRGIELLDRWASTIFADIIMNTKYITSFNSGTSRDGTTSLALISASVAKFMLMSRMVGGKENNKLNQIPTTIVHMILDIIGVEFSKLIQRDRILIWDEVNCNYFDKEDYKKYAINAVKTTVDSEYGMYHGFEDLIDTCLKEKINILDIYEAAFESENGDPRIEFRTMNGAKFKANSIAKDMVTVIQNEPTMLFIMDGFIDEAALAVFKTGFKDWFRKLISVKMGNDYVFDPSKEGHLNAPVFLITRTPNYLVDFYRNLAINGLDPEVNAEFVIKPRFLLAYSDDQYQFHYQDILDIFPNNIIDLNKMNHYIIQDKDESFFDFTTGKWKKDYVSDKRTDITHMFPYITGVEGNNMVVLDTWKVTGERVIKSEEHEHRIKTVAREMADKDVGASTSDPVDVLVNKLTFDGSNLYVSPAGKTISERMKAKREQIHALIQAQGQNTSEETDLPKRRDCFNMTTLVPIIYSRASQDAEYNYVRSVLDDAMGVFRSVHKNGVVGGANTYLLKIIDELSDNVLNTIDKSYFTDYDDEKKHLYKGYARSVLSSIKMGYEYVYSILDEKGVNHFYEIVPKDVLDVISTYDIVSGKKSNSVIEAAKTTEDVFVCMLNVLRDMLLIKRIKIVDPRDIGTINRVNRIRDYHPINLKVLTNDQKEEIVNWDKKGDVK